MDNYTKIQTMWPILHKKVDELELGAPGVHALEQWYTSLSAGTSPRQLDSVAMKGRHITNLTKVMRSMSVFEVCVIPGLGFNVAESCFVQLMFGCSVLAVRQ